MQESGGEERRRRGARRKQEVWQAPVAGDRQKVGNQAKQGLQGPGDANDAEKPADLCGGELILPEMRLDGLSRETGGGFDNALNEIEGAKEGQSGPENQSGVKWRCGVQSPK